MEGTKVLSQDSKDRFRKVNYYVCRKVKRTIIALKRLIVSLYSLYSLFCIYAAENIKISTEK